MIMSMMLLPWSANVYVEMAVRMNGGTVKLEPVRGVLSSRLRRGAEKQYASSECCANPALDSPAIRNRACRHRRRIPNSEALLMCHSLGLSVDYGKGDSAMH
jgi:hypothetical protein